MVSWAAETFGVAESTIRQLLVTVVVIVVAAVIRALILRAAARRIDDTETLFRIRKTVTYIATFLAFLVIAQIWATAFDDLATFLGLLSAGIAIALADVFLNLAGWAYIMLRRPFRAGDRVEIGRHAGDVVDIRILRFTLLEINNWVDADQSTGRLVHIPNGLLFRESMANYTEGFNHIWHEVPVLVTFESDWRRAEQVIAAILDGHRMDAEEMHAAQELNEAAKEYILHPGDLRPVVYVDVKDSGVLLTARLLIHPHERRAISDALWREILAAFADEPTIDFAYPTLRTYSG